MCMWTHAVGMQLEKGDILILDNEIMRHGRYVIVQALPLEKEAYCQRTCCSFKLCNLRGLIGIPGELFHPLSYAQS